MLAGPDIFLSYNREDAERAKQFAQAFEGEGFDVWWDVALRSGEAYDQVTEDALRKSKAVVVLWSPRSVVSRWVRAEATLADRNKVLVPATIEPCDRPIMFELTQTAELSHWDGDPFDRAWQAFLADVQGFVERARAKEEPVAAQSIAAAAPFEDPRPGLAIMPFVNRSGQATDDLFAEGMAEDLIAALSMNRELRVISNSATRSYGESGYDVRQVGSELGAKYLLEGNIRRVGDNMRVTAQLVEAGSGEILWTQRFDRPLADMAALQEDMVVDVAAHLGVQVNKIEVERALRKPGNLTAWESMLRASALGLAQTIQSLQESLVESRRAVQLAPEFGLAHAQLAMNLSGNYWQVPGFRTEEIREEVYQAARQAIKLDSENPKVLVLAAQAVCLTGRWKEGQRWAERAVEINPDLEASHVAMVMVCNYFNRPQEALEHLDAIRRLAPRSGDAHIRAVQRAGALYMAGRYEEALEANRTAMMTAPEFPFAVKDMVIYNEKLGRREEALEALAELKAMWPGLTLEHVGRMHKGSVLNPTIADEYQALFATVWNAAEGA
ncbi:TIR domain-containing protein [Altererythrobacter salegens]|uniref:TIR domain-containing protein n=1 Tax=Croceibacterium salegens TaxID=1737568 RepID=A0A6I4STW2_9SPHN|nr:TIR domain-containing protein [Croceibacterium salegens]MXO58370.1 TIR domain-containing protein [Croceibacterium salegens]